MAATAWVAASCSRPSGTSNASTPRQASIPRHGDHDRSCRVVRAARRSHVHPFARRWRQRCHQRVPPGKTGDRLRRGNRVPTPATVDRRPLPTGSARRHQVRQPNGPTRRAENRSLLPWRAPYRGGPRMSDRGCDAAAAPEGVPARIRSEGSQSLVRRQPAGSGTDGSLGNRREREEAYHHDRRDHAERDPPHASDLVELGPEICPRNVIELLSGNGDARDRATLDRDENEGRRDHDRPGEARGR